MATAGAAGLSLTCCRNVLMFLDRSRVSQIAARLYDALAPGGFVPSGPSGCMPWPLEPPPLPKSGASDVASPATAALTRCDEALARSSGALALRELGRHAEVVSARRRVLYLDGKLALAHFGLAALYERTGDCAAVVRGYRNVLACCDGASADAELPLGDGIGVAGL